uniref:PSI-F n=1 Tax=Prymnesium polylepis TaxID=72548 RepID=A0A6V4TKD7_9EUKA
MATAATAVVCALMLPAATAFQLAAPLPLTTTRAARHPAPVALDEARQKLIKGGLPQRFAERVSFQTGGAKQVGQEEMILTLWKEFKKCYPSEAVAQEMLSKNTAVILPSLNSPRKIKGTYALLNKRLGKATAKEVLLKNPGVLVCSPESLEKQSDEEIIKAANLVETLENNKPIINAVAGVVWFGIIGAFVYRIGTVGATPPGLS